MKFTSKDLENFERNLNNPLRIMKQLGELMRSRIMRSFGEQQRGKFAWRERGVPNVMGIISDLERGVTVKGRRFESRPALKDTGNLEKSFGRGKENIVMPNKLTVEVGTPVIYAPKLNEGGTSEKKITPQIKKSLSKYIKQMKKKANKSVHDRRKKRMTKDANSLGWIFRKESVKVTIPARPFAIITQRDLQDQVKIIEGNFLK